MTKSWMSRLDLRGRDRPRGDRRFVAAWWQEFGAWGRTALAALALALVTVTIMGFSIERAAREDITAARAEQQRQLISGIDATAVLNRSGTESFREFDRLVRQQILGGDTVRVKLWDPEGVIVYSDVPELIDQAFELGDDTLEAFAGETIVEVADVDGPENVFERDFGSLIEFYMPVLQGEEVIGVFEIYQTAASLESTLARIRRDVWQSVLAGIGFLGLVVGSLIVGNVHALNQQRRQAERTADELMRVTEADRTRIVEAMHDDIGQPLYRILYGLAGVRARTDDGLIDTELEELQSLVIGVDQALRSEIRLLSRSALREVGLSAAVEDLVKGTAEETDLRVTASIAELPHLSTGSQAALYRAVQEALFNARKHAGSGASVDVSLSGTRTRAYASIVDDGIGWNGREGIGLTTVQRTLEAVGGGVTISSRAHGGTVVNAWVPVAREEVLA